MNAYERFHAMLNGTPCDLLPRMPILMAFKARYAALEYRSFATDYRAKSAANLMCASEFGFDVVDVMSDPYCETEGFGGKIEYPLDDVPRCPRPPLATTDDLEGLLQPDPVRSIRMANTVETVRAYKERAFKKYSIHGWVEGPAAEAADLRGTQRFLMDLLLAPGWCAELMDLCTEVAIGFARAQIEAGADVIGVGESICSQIPPDTYADLIAPRQKLLFESIHASGAKVRLHICGDITHLLPYIKNVGVDVLDVDHLTDITEVRETLGTDKTVAGNLDPVADLLQGNPEDIKEKVRAIYRRIGNPMIVTAGCEIPRDTPHQNLEALCSPVPYRPD